MNFSSLKSKRSAGFTLIEIMVSIGIFSTVMLIGIGALLSVNDANRKARALRVVMDNLNFAVEDMARKMRIGDDFYCFDYDSSSFPPSSYNLEKKQDCPNGKNAIIFKFKKERTGGRAETVLYNLAEKPDDKKIVETRIIDSMTRNFSSPSFITSPEEIFIKNLKFYVTGSESPTKQPRITIVVSGEIRLAQEKIKTSFNIQTTISQRRAGS